MTARASEPERDQFVTMRVDWHAFEALLAMRGEKSRPRLAYLDGVAQLMSPSFDHEVISRLIGQLVSTYCLERKIPFVAVGSWTQKGPSEEAGAEPDECFVFCEDPRSKSRPDLVIEVIWTSGGIDKLEIYRRLGIREVWFWDAEQITVYTLADVGYLKSSRSQFVPGLDLSLVCRLVHVQPFNCAIEQLLEAIRS